MPRSKTKPAHRDNLTRLRLTVTPPSKDELLLRQTVQQALEQTFGLSRAFTYFDFVVNEADSDEIVIQVATLDAPYFTAALAAFSGHNTFSVKEQVDFLSED
ncbi:hypothetical protein M408DRAFT_331642 [Serendipita vermifera MAFF 305830]|uniref:Uncharacterized protein n=1 Tax=Serendipita vermifera MAFF 305830 TaxID=933852 RepID=A0A0C2X5W0_SERVB|nr:hypothetical protein M408DRAFT_331642 [Serendipita vermifera MAFF 305830]